MDAEASVKLYENKIKQLCATFLGNEWMDNGNVRIVRILTGCLNRTFKCTLNGVTKKDVIVKIYGSELLEKAKETTGEEIKKHSDDSPFNSEAAEILIIDRLAARGMAPKLYGLFSGGRIEQYIEGRTPTLNDFEDKTLIGTVARNVARYHDMAIPIPKIPKYIEGIAKWAAMMPTLTDYSHIPEEHKDAVRRLFEFDLVGEFDWAFKMSPKINSPIKFCHNDLQICNMILRDNYSTCDERIMFVDYEGSCYNYRGFDMAYFLTIFEFTFVGGVEKAEITYTGNKCDKKSVLYFIKQYLSAFGDQRKLNPKIDTVDHIEMEIAFFQLEVYLVFLIFVRGFVSEPERKDPCTEVQPLLDSYERQKQYFFSKYPQFSKV